MGGFLAYDGALSAGGPPDRWADLGLDDAVGHLRGFDDGDWARLVEHLPAARATWRARCAETLSEVDPAHALPLLLTLLQDEDPEVSEAAADSLASLAQDGATLTLDVDARAALARLVARGGLAAAPAQRLLARS